MPRFYRVITEGRNQKMKGATKNLLAIVAIVVAALLIVHLYSKTKGKAMVIVEPRKHELLKYVCENFDKNMCKSWDLYVFHGKSHGSFAEEATEDIRQGGRKVFLMPLDTDNLTAGEYNRLLKRLDFWDRVKAEDILVFQTDAVLCGNSDHKIREFTKYDYVGCSNNKNTIGDLGNNWGTDKNGDWSDDTTKNLSFYGIGGLSFRKNSFQKKCIRDYPNINPEYGEDVFFSGCLEKSQNKPRDVSTTRNFCTQNVFYSRSFGAHKISVLKDDQRAAFFEFCPAAVKIKDA